MRFAWRVQPRNYLLGGCHFANWNAQLYLLYRKVTGYTPEALKRQFEEEAAAKEAAAKETASKE